MKIKDGKIKLDKRDVRVGNFIFTREPEHIKVQDISGMVSCRYHMGGLKWKYLNLLLEESQKNFKFLQNEAVLMSNFLLVVPDMEFYEEVNKAIIDCINRHPNFYDIKEDISQKEDDKILTEEKTLYEAMEEVKEKTDNNSE